MFGIAGIALHTDAGVAGRETSALMLSAEQTGPRGRKTAEKPSRRGCSVMTSIRFL